MRHRALSSAYVTKPFITSQHLEDKLKGGPFVPSRSIPTRLPAIIREMKRARDYVSTLLPRFRGGLSSRAECVCVWCVWCVFVCVWRRQGARRFTLRRRALHEKWPAPRGYRYCIAPLSLLPVPFYAQTRAAGAERVSPNVVILNVCLTRRTRVYDFMNGVLTCPPKWLEAYLVPTEFECLSVAHWIRAGWPHLRCTTTNTLVFTH